MATLGSVVAFSSIEDFLTSKSASDIDHLPLFGRRKILEVPIHGAFQPVHEPDGRLVAEQALRLADVGLRQVHVAAARKFICTTLSTWQKSRAQVPSPLMDALCPRSSAPIKAGITEAYGPSGSW